MVAAVSCFKYFNSFRVTAARLVLIFKRAESHPVLMAVIISVNNRLRQERSLLARSQHVAQGGLAKIVKEHLSVVKGIAVITAFTLTFVLNRPIDYSDRQKFTRP